jgi:hypothetical protein
MKARVLSILIVCAAGDIALAQEPAPLTIAVESLHRDAAHWAFRGFVRSGSSVKIFVDRGVPDYLLERMFRGIPSGGFVPSSAAPLSGVGVGFATRNGSGCFQGTIGTAVVPKGHPDEPPFRYITNNHVAAAVGRDLCPNGDPLNSTVAKEMAASPAFNDCNPLPASGHLEWVTHISYDQPNTADVAIVATNDKVDSAVCGDVTCFAGQDVAIKNDPVFICKGGSSLQGMVEGRGNVVVRYNLCDVPTEFDDQIMVKGLFAVEGDSGAPVYKIDNKGNALLVGLVFAGDEDYTFINPIQHVLTALHDRVEVPFCPRK